ncbi:unnamed protein product [Somion occarium]|uniref:Glucose-methanol-choline oxidoreductase C-terminal domain-containing protein n=1 Tax=Somion occarium TaxID=3059160 RepID=A0ABP1DGW5_9APHY
MVCGIERLGLLGRKNGYRSAMAILQHAEYLQTGTCRMGPDPRTSVIDANLRVHGTAGLRVIDTSIFPDNVSGHPAAPVVAVAEKAADMIKESWRL